MRYAEFVLGNTSGGIIETPKYHVPKVNFGERQRGRLQSESVINCGSPKEEIVNAIRIALSKEHKELCKSVISLYGDSHAAECIVQKVVETIMYGELDLKKDF